MTQFVVSLVVTFVAAPGVRWLMLHRGIIDVPNQRSSHLTPTPRGGGLACLTGMLVAATIAQIMDQPIPWVAIATVGALATVGLADDRFDLSPVVRLGAQLGTGFGLGAALGGYWFALLGVLAVPAIVNAVNFMDGINGITGLTMAAWSIAALWSGLSHGVPSLAAIGAITLGSAAGFLPWNIPIARLFLGDIGSYLFGALVASGVLIGASHGISPLLLLAPLTLYFADTGSTLVRRFIRHQSLLQPHRDHTYQRLTNGNGYSHTAVSGWVGFASLTVGAAWMTSPWWMALCATCLFVGAYLASPRLMPIRNSPTSVTYPHQTDRGSIETSDE